MISAFHKFTSAEKLLILGALIATILGKILTVSVYGPLAMGDNGGYVDAATEILSSQDWIFDAGLSETAIPPTLWRPIGYSLVIAASKNFFAENWAISVCALQSVLSFIAGVMLFNLCHRANLNILLSTLVFLFYQWSAPLSTDALIMEDALVGSIGMMAFIHLLGPVIDGRIPSFNRFLVVGLTAAISFLIRDVYHFVMPVLAVATFIILGKIQGLRHGCFAALALALPVFLIANGVQAWNAYRTGTAITTTAGQTAYLYGLLQAARFDPAILDRETPALKTVREINKTFEYVDARAINHALFERSGMTSVEQAQIFSHLYWSTFLTAPVPMIRAALARTRIIQQGTLFAGPVTRIDDLDWWRGNARSDIFYGTGWRADAQAFRQSLNPRDLTIEVAAHLALRTITRGFGLIVFCVFVVGTPVLWWRLRKKQDRTIQAAFIAWAVYALWVCMYIPISFEIRYLAPVIGPALFSVAVAIKNYRILLTPLFSKNA